MENCILGAHNESLSNYDLDVNLDIYKNHGEITSKRWQRVHNNDKRKMILKQGNMWESRQDVILVTTNSIKTRDGSLVMGGGAAYEAKMIWPDISLLLGEKIINRSVYGLIILKRREHLKYSIGAFQVKIDWRDKAIIKLIQNSVQQLAMVAIVFPDTRFALNFPGIGLGDLKREDVLPTLQGLPDNVQVWER